jgi:hypothetical protein
VAEHSSPPCCGRAAPDLRFDYTVRVTNVYRKVNGRWLIVREHVSLPIDRTTFQPLLKSALPTDQGH